MTTQTLPRRPRGRPRDPSADVRILAATIALVGVHGVAGASMSAIADRSGVGKPTIYLRWPNRPAVVRAAIHQVVEDMDGDTEAALFDAQTAVRRLAGRPNGRFLLEAVVMPRGEVHMGGGSE